ncbi:hypothetical protein FE257_001616 [Aspergillus nanangensis]|uniref:GDP/GTP exchange factor Sec2 N-terminal domain-containing protein n=1 Tax=Aspergillus nanangensis TaxID=2582783 RepID=A0AAD4CU37_ASPNN|nr:hypothetical protein FE257_001616 [Aspergillus nanangensis]
MLPTITNATALVSGKNCPTCGQDGLLSHRQQSGDAHKRIKELEGHVEDLNVQAMQMADKLAQYEDEVRRLRTQSRSSASSSSSSAQFPDPPDTQQQGRLSTLTSFLPYRRPSTTSPTQTAAQPAVAQPSPPSSAPHEETAELQNALNREQDLRRAAESQLSQANTELEDLTAQLFSQANEMVAQERKARARLEERVAVLERRDVEKRSRLDRLEKAMERVERVRALVKA